MTSNVRRRALLVGAVGAVGTAAIALAGCALIPRPTVVPMQIIRDTATCAAPVDTLVVVLPGAYSLPKEFVDEGMLRALRTRGIAADAWIVDAHIGYYEERTIIDRLQADVIEPARAHGYRRIWLVGISVGGFGAMIHARAHPGAVDGIVVLAPYLGQRSVVDEVRQAGGLRAWKAPEGELPLDQMERTLWRWLQGAAERGAERPPLYLGYGRSDRFIDAHELLAAALPPSHVYTVPGGHDWAPWRMLWNQMLEALPLPRDPSCVRA